MKKKKRILKKRRILFLFLILIIGVFLIYKTFFNVEKIEIVSSIEDYPYYLESNETKIYKKYYKQLEKELSDNKIDEENYASLISKLFIIDFYTLSNKVTNQDVGGVQFIYKEIQEDFASKATNTIYKYVKSNIYNNRSQKLPTVKDVEISSINQIIYEYNDKKDASAFKVEVEIKYKKDLGYDTNKTLVIVHEEEMLLSIVEIK